ncbi:MAG: monophosphatase [Actinomycetota bacterium]|jgi:myo-inositol-1(or 4)-monophosphatase|nr:monophosphatase [Actinomycetota bacterium]
MADRELLPHRRRLTADGGGLPDLLDLALGLAGQASALLLEAQRHPSSGIDTKSSVNDMVSDADRASEALIVAGILGARPDDAILAEEGASRPGTSGVRWVIDPLDGTTNYLYGLPAWAVSIAVEVDGVVEVGVVADPSHREVYSAVRGEARAWCNRVPISVSDATALATSLIGTGFAYRSARRAEQALALPRLLPAVRDIRRLGAAALDLCLVACGRLDGYFETGLQPWDMAAGVLIASVAGAVVCDYDGGPPSTASVVAAGPGIVTELLATLAAAGVTPDPGPFPTP